MSEGGAGGSVMDAKQFIYLPKWVKAAILVAAAALLVLAAVGIQQALIAKKEGESIVFYVSVAQTAALVLIFFLVATFSRRDANADQLHLLTDEFLKRYVAQALRRVSIPEREIMAFDVVDEGRKDIFGRALKMEFADFRFRLWVGLNVRRLFVIYYVPVQEGMSAERLKEIFKFTFGGAEKVGFHLNFEDAVVDKRKIVSIWLTVDTIEDLLSSPHEKLFWAQDVAMMTESFLRTATRNGIDLDIGTLMPAPL